MGSDRIEIEIPKLIEEENWDSYGAQAIKPQNGYECPHCGGEIYFMEIAWRLPVAHPYYCSKCKTRYMLLCDLRKKGESSASASDH